MLTGKQRRERVRCCEGKGRFGAMKRMSASLERLKRRRLVGVAKSRLGLLGRQHSCVARAITSRHLPSCSLATCIGFCAL